MHRFPCYRMFLLFSCAYACGCSHFSGRRVDADVITARQYSMQGMDALGAGQFQRAEELFGEAIQLCPADERAHTGYAKLLWQNGRRDEALVAMQEAVRLSAGDPELLVQLGEMNLAEGQLGRAMVYANRALRGPNPLARAYVLRGAVFAESSQLDLSLADYHQALTLQPNNAKAQIAAAHIYARQNRPHRALATLQSLADRYPPGSVPVDILYLQGLALKALGRYQDCILCLTEAESRGLHSPELAGQLENARGLASRPARTTVKR